MKIIQVVPNIDSVGGPSFSVPLNCDILANFGNKVQLHVLEPCSRQKPENYELHIHPVRNFLNRLGISNNMALALRKQAKTAQILHNNGLWMMPNVYPGWVTKGTQCKLVVSPHGTLSEWALGRSYWRKRAFWWLLQKKPIMNSTCLHATSYQEYVDIRNAGCTAPVFLVPNPIQVPEQPKRDLQERRRLLYLARIHPIKGIENLLRAWSQVEAQFLDWDLHIVGPDNDGYLDKMKGLARELNLERASFLPPVYGSQKDETYAQADLYVLPTFTENFGITVAEALAAGVPAITTHGAPWQKLEEKKCGWWIPRGPEALTSCLQEALKVPRHQLEEMGQRGREMVKEDFSPQTIGQKTMMAYEWILHGGTPPPFLFQY